MPEKGNTSSEKSNKAPLSKKLSSWVVQRFADLRSLFTAKPTINLTNSPLAPDIGRSYLGDTTNRLTRQVINRTGLSLSTFKHTNLPLITGTSNFIISRLTSSPTIWQRALSLPWVRQNRRERAKSSRIQYESAGRPPIESTILSSRDIQFAQYNQQYSTDTELQPDSEEVNTSKVISEELRSLVTNIPLTMPVTNREALSEDKTTRYDSVNTSFSQSEEATGSRSMGNITRATSINQNAQSVSSTDETYPAVINTQLLPSVSSRRLDRIIDESPYTTHTRSLPLITGKVETWQQVGEADERISRIPYVYRSETSKRTTDESQQSEMVEYVETEGTREESAQVNRQGLNRYLNQPLSKMLTPITQRHLIQPKTDVSTLSSQPYQTRPSSDVLTPVTQRVTVRRSLLEPRTYTAEKNILESEISPLRRDSEQTQSQPEIGLSSTDDRQVSVPLITSSKSNQPANESSTGAGHILPLMLTYEPSGRLQNKASPEHELNLVTPVLADEISHRFSQSQLQKSAVRLDGPVSNLTSTQEVTSGRGSGTLPFEQTRQSVPKAGQTSTSDSISSRLQQQALDRARSTKTTASEVKKSPRRVVVQRTIVEPDSAKSSLKSPEDVASDKGSGELPSGQTPQPVPEVEQSSMEKPATNSLQRATEQAEVMHTPMGEVVKRSIEPTAQRTAIEPDSEVMNETLPQEISRSDSSQELQYRVEPRSSPKIIPSQTKESTIKGAINIPEVLSQDTGTASSLNRDLGEVYTEKGLSYRHPLSFVSPVTRPITVIRDISGVVDIPSPQPFKHTINRHINDDNEDLNILQSGEYKTTLSDYGYTGQSSITLPVASSVKSRAESGFTLNERLFKNSSDTIPELPYSWTHNSGNHSSMDLSLAPVSRAPETSNVTQTADQEPQESGGEEGEKEESSIDLKALAREVYPYLKRMIMVERDRQPK